MTEKKKSTRGKRVRKEPQATHSAQDDGISPELMEWAEAYVHALNRLPKKSRPSAAIAAHALLAALRLDPTDPRERVLHERVQREGIGALLPDDATTPDFRELIELIEHALDLGRALFSSWKKRRYPLYTLDAIERLRGAAPDTNPPVRKVRFLGAVEYAAMIFHAEGSAKAVAWFMREASDMDSRFTRLQHRLVVEQFAELFPGAKPDTGKRSNNLGIYRVAAVLCASLASGGTPGPFGVVDVEKGRKMFGIVHVRAKSAWASAIKAEAKKRAATRT